MRESGLLNSVGNTPLIELRALSPKPGVRIFAKLEGQNPSGSIKDRIAVAMIDDAERRGLIQPGQTLVEASTGNTAIALAMVAKQRGYKLQVVVPEGVVPSIEDVLDLYGVDIRWCRPRAGMLGAIEEAQELAKREGFFALRQFDNPANLRVHYETTGVELRDAFLAMGEAPTVLVAGLGTGGTLMGAGRRLRETWPALQLIGVEPRMGERLQGLRSLDEAFHPPFIDMNALSGRFLVSAARALRAARRVAREEGVLVGVSSGAVLHAALALVERIEHGNVVLICSDGGWKYLPARPWDAAQADNACLDETHWW